MYTQKQCWSQRDRHFGGEKRFWIYPTSSGTGGVTVTCSVSEVGNGTQQQYHKAYRARDGKKRKRLDYVQRVKTMLATSPIDSTTAMLSPTAYKAISTMSRLRSLRAVSIRIPGTNVR